MGNMQWEKKFGPHHINYRDFLLLSTVITIVLGLYFKEPILYIIIGLFLAYIVINLVYDRTIGTKLYMENTSQTIRMFQREQEKLTFRLENQSILPLIHGQFRFQIDPILTTLEEKNEDTEAVLEHAFQKSFSIKAKGETEVHFPFEAKSRGVARVRGITYTMPHLFNFDMISLSYIPNYFIEVIVYPNLLHINGIEKAFQLTPSEQRVNLSPFEDIQSPIGTRDYQYSDPFHQINWKASAKTQVLQTNVYEKVVDMSYLVIVNIRGDTQIGLQTNDLMEKLLSYTAYLCRYTLDMELPYELYINARSASRVPYLHLPEGKGSTHYIRSLEMLARIPKYAMTYPFSQMVNRIKNQVSSPKTIIIVGDMPHEVIPLLGQWSRMQKDIFHVKSNEESPILKRWHYQDVKVHA